MANRIVGNTYIIDTASGNTALPWPSKAKVMAVNFISTATNGTVSLSGTTTSDVVVRLTYDNPRITLGGVNFDEMKAPIVTAGTAWVYFA